MRRAGLFPVLVAIVPGLVGATTMTTLSYTTTTTPATTSTSRAADHHHHHHDHKPVTPPGTCRPPNCDDRGLCEPGACVDGVCLYTLLTGLDAVSCRLDQITERLASAPLTAIHGPALARRLLAKLRQLSGLVQAGRTGGQRGGRALRRADHGLAAFLGAINSAVSRGRLDVRLTTSVMGLAIAAKAALHLVIVQP